MNSYGKYTKYLITVLCTSEMEVCTRGQKTVLMHFHLVSLHFFTVFPLPGVSLFIPAVNVLFILKDSSLYYNLHQVSLSSLIWSQPFPFLKASGNLWLSYLFYSTLADAIVICAYVSGIRFQVKSCHCSIQKSILHVVE